MRSVGLVLLLSCSILAAGQSSQSTSSGSSVSGIRASVLYASGEHVPGAEVVLYPAGQVVDDLALRQDASYGAGFAVRPGNYTVTAKFSSLFKKTVPITVSPDEVTSALFVLLEDQEHRCGTTTAKEMPAVFPRSSNQAKEGTLALTLFDANAAVIPGGVIPRMKVELVSAADNASGATPTPLSVDSLGSAIVSVSPGSYLLKIQAYPFHQLSFRFAIGGGDVLGVAAVLAVMGTCDGVNVDVPERSITPPSPKDHIDPKHP